MNHSLLMWRHLITKAMSTNESFNESIKITQITTTQTSQPQKRETGPTQQTRHSCNALTLSKRLSEREARAQGLIPAS